MTTKSETTAPKKRGLRVWLVYLMLSLFGYTLNVAGPAVAYLRDELNLNFTQSGMHTSALALGMILMGLVGSALLKRMSEWKALGLSGLGMGVGGLLLVIGKDPVLTLSGLFIMGAVGSLAISTNPAILADEMGEKSPLGISEANTLSAIISTLAPIAVGFFGAQAISWRPAVYLPGILASLLGLIILISPKFSWKKKPETTEQKANLTQLPAKFWLVFTMLVFSVAVEFCTIYWASDYMQANLNMAKESATQGVSLFLVGMVIGRMVGSRLHHKIERNKVLLSSIALGLFGFAIFWLSRVESLSIVGLFIAGTGVANLYASMITLCFEAAGKERAAAGAATTLASGVAIFALPFALGSLADLISIRYAVLLIPFLFLILGFLFIFNSRSEPKKVRG